jgi:hypothetical protein
MTQNLLQKKISSINEDPTGEKPNKVELSESDTEIDNYTMISNEFNFEALKEKDNFGIKGYKDSIYKG